MIITVSLIQCCVNFDGFGGTPSCSVCLHMHCVHMSTGYSLHVSAVAMHNVYKDFISKVRTQRRVRIKPL